MFFNKNNNSVKGESLWNDAFKRLKKNRAAMAGGVVVVVLIIVAILAPWIAPFHYAQGNFADTYANPSGKYLLGSDFMGRDLLSRLIYGTRISLTVGTLGALFAFLIGTSFGTVAGYFGGKIDNIMMRIVDIFYAFPSLLFIILMMVLFKGALAGDVERSLFVQYIAGLDKSLGGMLFILVGISLTTWVDMARLSRGMALSLRETEFIQAAQALGANNSRIMLKHLVPNLVSPLLVRVTLDIPTYIAIEAFLSFIGLGVDPPTPSWGAMIQEGIKSMRSYPHLTLFPGLALAMTMLAFNFLGDGLRDAIDPKMKQ